MALFRVYTTMAIMLGSLLMVWMGWSPHVGSILGLSYTSPYKVPLGYVSQILDTFTNGELFSFPNELPEFQSTSPKPIQAIFQKFALPINVNNFSLPGWNPINVAVKGVILQSLWVFFIYPASPLSKPNLVGRLLTTLFWAVVS